MKNKLILKIDDNDNKYEIINYVEKLKQYLNDTVNTKSNDKKIEDLANFIIKNALDVQNRWISYLNTIEVPYNLNPFIAIVPDIYINSGKHTAFGSFIFSSIAILLEEGYNFDDEKRMAVFKIIKKLLDGSIQDINLEKNFYEKNFGKNINYISDTSVIDGVSRYLRNKYSESNDIDRYIKQIRINCFVDREIKLPPRSAKNEEPQKQNPVPNVKQDIKRFELRIKKLL
ncbi:MAG: hypothetical protein ACP5LH_02725 [Candidatus Micrarchaeia archaeon]